MVKNNLLGNIKKQVSFKKTVNSLIALGAVLVFVYLYNKYVIPYMNYNIENFENENSKKLVYFYMNGCGHCEKFSPIWDEFISQNKSSITTHKLEREEAGNKIQKYEVKGFPTILLLDENNNKIKEYNGDRTLSALKKFVSEN